MFIIAGVLAGFYYAWNYSQHYGDVQDKASQLDVSITDNYDVSTFDGAAVPVEIPALPDLTKYTVENIRAKKSPLSAGVVSVQKLEVGYAKIRGEINMFAEKQWRLNPLTIVIESGNYNLDGLVAEVNNAELIYKRSDGAYVLAAPLAIRPNSGFIIDNGQTLLLDVEKGGLISNFGDFFVVDAKLKGWNISKDAPAEFKSRKKFRPYVATWCGSNMYLANSDIAHLGYSKSKSYGITYTSCRDTLYREDYAELDGGTGWLIGNTFTDMYFGFYSYEANDVAIVGNRYIDNIVYGIDPHDRSERLIIANNHVSGSKEKHGIIVSREVNHSFIINNLSENNKGTGIMLDRSSEHNVIANNIARNNEGDGITFYESPHNISFNNKFIKNGASGIRIRNSIDITSYKDVINYNVRSGVQLYTDTLTERDLDLDPYNENVDFTLVNPEMIGNEEASFKFADIDAFSLNGGSFYQAPDKMFAGDFRDLDSAYRDAIFKPDGGLRISKKPIQ